MGQSPPRMAGRDGSEVRDRPAFQRGPRPSCGIGWGVQSQVFAMLLSKPNGHRCPGGKALRIRAYEQLAVSELGPVQAGATRRAAEPVLRVLTPLWR